MPSDSSTSEDNGLAVLTDNDLTIYSVGISTGGVAEIRMAQTNPRRQIIATTIDAVGADFAEQQIAKAGYGQQIETKLEDVAKPLPYPDNTFDYVYARLVLHYLTEQELICALAEQHRILKPAGKLFVVVRSTKCPNALQDNNTFDPITHLTAYTYTNKTGEKKLLRRFFHTEESIGDYVRDAGFSMRYIKSYDEQLFSDFEREIQATDIDNVIELLAVK
jgi:ubiquinone/menaquinone biosynthesis C-methylase UbiE